MKPRKWTKWTLLATLLLAGTVGFVGCGDDDDNGTTPPTNQGKYDITAGFEPGAAAALPNANTGDMDFVATVERLNSSDESAMECEITVDGTDIPLESGSTDNEAHFRSDVIEYEEGTSYAVVATLGSSSATSTLTAPQECTVTITSPEDGATVVAGDGVALVWEYDGATPAEVSITALTGGQDLYEKDLSGATTSYTIPGSETSSWDDYDQVQIIVEVGETQSFSGELASESSESYVLLSDDTITLEIEGEPGPPGEYFLSAMFMVDDEGGEGVTALISVDRGNPADTPANEATVEIDGTALTLAWGGDDEATWMADLSYELSHTYTVTVTLDGETATANIEAYDRRCQLRITAPANFSEFTVGTDIALAWQYAYESPHSLVVGAGPADTTPGDDEFFSYDVDGAQTSLNLPTSAWSDCDSVIVVAGVSDDFTWNGSPASADSHAGIIVTMDLLFLFGEGFGPGESEWSLELDLDDSQLPADGSSTTAWVEILDESFNPCEDGTQVTFSVDRPDLATVSPTTATTTNGEAEATVTVGTTEGTVIVTATALGEEDDASLIIGELEPPQIWWVEVTPDPDLYPGGIYELPADGSSTVVLNLTVTNLQDEIYPNDITLTAESSWEEAATVSPTSVVVTGGTASVTVTAGTYETGMFPFAILFEVVDPPDPPVYVSGTHFQMKTVAP
jgi:hypothetical protein